MIESGKLYVLTGGGTTALISQDLQFASPTVYSHPALASGEAARGFSLASRTEDSRLIIVAVGGDYKAANETKGTAVYCAGECRPADTPPHGYRSAVAYDEATGTWIAAGPNGVDLSTDDGRNWRPFEAGRTWNAISLPFLVGSQGRIGTITLPPKTK